MSYRAAVIADSLSPDGVRLTTIEVTFPRIVLAEFNTHRVFSRNSASSRAIPIAKRIAMVESNPYVPNEFGSNQKGMQSGAALVGEEAARSERAWRDAARDAVVHARTLEAAGVHKEYANRLLEPFCWHTVIVTATEWDNYWGLRCTRMASPPIRIASEMMLEAYQRSEPRSINYGEWHLPYVDSGDVFNLEVRGQLDQAIQISCARCARVSYLTHDGKRDHGADLELYSRLRGPGHMSPLEHAARPAENGDVGLVETTIGNVSASCHEPARAWFGNFRGWVQHRKLIPGEAVFRTEAAE